MRNVDNEAEENAVCREVHAVEIAQERIDGSAHVPELFEFNAGTQRHGENKTHRFSFSVSPCLCVVVVRFLTAHLSTNSIRLDRQQPVVFSEAFGLGDGADFDLVGAPADGEVGEPVVFGLAAAGTHCDFPAGIAPDGGLRRLQ